jgi:hypothetical protein
MVGFLFWTGVPNETISARTRDGARCDGSEEVAADIWFQNWERGGTLMEEACYLSQWDQTLSLLWVLVLKTKKYRHPTATSAR